jgi:outer membrane protein
MKTLLSAAIALSALAIPAAALAQAKPTILVVDTDRIQAECAACKTAATQLRQRETQLRARAATLQQQAQSEGKPIQDAIDALKGKQPDAALQQRVAAFETKQRGAQTELATAQRTLQSTAANVNQQIGSRLVQIVEQVRARRGATAVLSKNATLASDNTADVTTEALTALNQQLPTVSVTPLPQQPSPQSR